MFIISYNVNGIRAAVTKEFPAWLDAAAPDVVCIQESKAQPEQIPVHLFEERGYHSYWHSAERKGYSGVGILSKRKPDHVVYGMGIDRYDREGRLMRADFGELSVISVYHPMGAAPKPGTCSKWTGCATFINMPAS